MRVAIVAAEFFAPSASRVGGFGWAATRAAAVLRRAGHEPLLVCPDVDALHDAPPEIDGTPLLAKEPGGVVRFARDLRRARPDVILSIDYRPSYDTAFKAIPRTRAVVWVRDPRTPDAVAAVAAVRIPGHPPEEVPQGLASIDCTGLRTIARRSRLLRRRIRYASPAPDALSARAPGAYGFAAGSLALLPNPIPPRSVAAVKAPRPVVLFLGRLDPVKRPWLFVELARALPDVEFVMAGHAHGTGRGSWQPAGLPPNLRLRGHLQGEEKLVELDRAWALVSTSVHEGLAVSWLEALAARTPLVACVDTGDVVSRYGVHVGRFGGDGLAALPSLRSGLDRLLRDQVLRERLGAEGAAWVRSVHTPERFVSAFEQIAAGA